MYRKAVSTLSLLAYLDDHVHCVFDWSHTHFDRASVSQVYCQFLFDYEVYKLLRKFVLTRIVQRPGTLTTRPSTVLLI